MKIETIHSNIPRQVGSNGEYLATVFGRIDGLAVRFKYFVKGTGRLVVTFDVFAPGQGWVNVFGGGDFGFCLPSDGNYAEEAKAALETMAASFGAMFRPAQ